MRERGVACITTLTASESFSRRRLQDLSFLDDPLIRDTSPLWFLDALRQEAVRPLDEGEKTSAAASARRLVVAQANAKRLNDAGILLVAGTDAPSPGLIQGEGLHRELELLVEAGLSPLRAISAATKNAAMLMRAKAGWGTLEPGKRADLVLVDGRPDRRIGDTRRIRLVIQRGRIVDRAALRFDARRDRGFRPATSISS